MWMSIEIKEVRNLIIYNLVFNVLRNGEIKLCMFEVRDIFAWRYLGGLIMIRWRDDIT